VHLKRRQGPFSEAFVAVLGVGVVLAAARLPLPGVSGEALARVASGEGWLPIRIGGLGIMPLVPAFALVEVAVALAALVRGRDEPGARGRRVMTAVAFGLACVLAIAQAAGVVRYLASAHDVGLHGPVLVGSPWLAGACLAAYPLAAGGVALVVSRLGAGDGFSLVILASILSGAGHEAREVWSRLSIPPAAADDRMRALLVMGLTLLLLVAATVVLLRGRIERRGDPPVPLLASGALPWSIGLQVAGLGGLIATLAGWSVETDPAAGGLAGWSRALLAAASTLAAAVLLAWILRLPRRVARSNPDLVPRSFRARLLVLGLASGVALVALGHGTRLVEQVPFHLVGLDLVRLVVLVAVCMDLADRLLLRLRLGLSPSLLEVAVHHTVFDAEIASQRLRSAGVPHHVQGLFHRRVLYFAAAFVAMPVMVAETDVVRARMALGGGTRPASALETDPPPDPHGPS